MTDLDDTELLAVCGGQGALASPRRRDYLAERRHARELLETTTKVQRELAELSRPPKDDPLMKAFMGIVMDMMKRRRG